MTEPPTPGPAGVELGGRARSGPVRRLYAWVLHWAETPHAVTALALLAAAEASFFPVPPDPLLIALALGVPWRSLRLAAVATAASVLGGAGGYAIGFGAWAVVDQFFYQYVPGVSPEAFERVRALYDRYDFWAIFLAGLTPIPYKVFTLSAGVFSIHFPTFLAASVLSRGARFFLVAALIHRFGARVRRFIDRYFDALTWAFGILVVVGFLLVRYLL